MAASVLEVLITGDATSLKLAFTQATAATEQYAVATKTASQATMQAGNSATQFGNTMNRAFTYAKLGALAFAAVSVKSALDFNQEFTRIAAITNVADENIAGLKQTVIGLSQETAVAPTELAHALYFLASAGLKDNQVLEALDATAHGAAIGLGEAGDLARITANALNSFEDQGLTATQVMDTLTAALREGTAEPDEFATALGRVLPIADNAGISFQAVAASLATMSNAGLDVNEGVTALRAILQSLVAPTAQTTNAFETMGLTVTDVVASMKGQGLIGTLRMISERAKESTDSTGEYNQLLRHAIPNIRGLAGALNLTGQDAKKVDEIFNAVLNSTGDLAEAFETTAESQAFKVKQALNEINIAGMQLASATLPVLATALGFVADHAQLIVTALAAFAAVRWVLPFFRDLTVANTELAASEIAAGSAAVEQAAMMKAAQAVNMVPAPPMPGKVMPGQMQLPFAPMGQQKLFDTSSLVPARVDLEAFGQAAREAQVPIMQLQSASTGAMGSIARMGNTIGSSGLPQIIALTMAVQDGITAFRDFQNFGVEGLIQSVTGSFTAKTFAPFLPGGTAGQSFLSNILGAPGDKEHFEQAIAAIKQDFTLAGKTADEQSAIIQQAMSDIGGSLSTDNIDQFVESIRGQLDAENAAKLAADQQAAAELELTKQTQAADQATQAWQKSTDAMTSHLTGLSRIGIDVNSFMSELEGNLADSEDQAKTFTDAIDQVTQAWMDFRDNAAQSLNFAPQALEDLTSAAQQAQDSLDGMTKDSSITGNELAELQATANLTGQDILSAFQDAADQTRSFSKDLLELAHVGGAAGKDLASALLESGNVLAAQVIADSPAKIQRQIVHAYGESQSASEKFGTQLTDAIVGPLETIQDLLVQLAKKAFGVTLHYNDGGVKKKTQDTKRQLDEIAREHAITMALKDNASGGLRHLNSEVTGLVGTGPRQIVFQANTEQAKNQLAAFDEHLDNFLAQKREVYIGVHTGPNSPWPDEALKQRFEDPIKRMGFTRVGNRYTIPLDVAAYTDTKAISADMTVDVTADVKRSIDPVTSPIKKSSDGMVATLNAIRAEQHKIFEVQKRSFGVLQDIRGALKSGGGVGGGTGGTGGGGGGNGDGGGAARDRAPAISGPLVGMLRDFRLYVASVEGNKTASSWLKNITKAIQSGEGKPVHLIQQAMRDMAKVTNPEEARKATEDFRQAIRHWEATTNRQRRDEAQHPNLPFNPLPMTSPINKSLDEIAILMHRSGVTTGETLGVIKRVAQQGRDGRFIKQAVKDVRDELGVHAAKRYADALHVLDQRTAENSKHQEDAIKSALRMLQDHIDRDKQHRDMTFGANDEGWQEWIEKRMPSLPRGHTRIDPNEHNAGRHHRRQLYFDRRHMDDAVDYQNTYGRGY